ncbi:MAG TPA: hypothetical protein VNA88_02245 [Candidatus Kapabacteria bacterium]|nr:hypothetical protein [Candidatus Kapabacteria bacterium]
MIPVRMRSPEGLWSLAIAIGVGTIVVAGVLLFATFWGDPVIYLPYARSNAAGDFFAYNPGVFSSGATSPLWSLILAIPYLFGADVIGAKVVGLLATLGSFIVLAAMAARFNGRNGGSGVALLYAVEMMTIFGLMMYESPLAVAAVALSLVAGDRLLTRWRTDGRITLAAIAPLAAVWALMPLSRPDATLLVPLQIAALWIAGPQRSARTLATLVGAAAVAAIPAALYFGYSYTTLGTISVSSKCRAFALKESADRIGPILLSRKALGYLGSILYAIALGGLGLDLLRRDRRTTWIGLYGGAAMLMYPVLLVFVQPVTNDLPRYFLPIAPFIVLGAGRALAEAERRLRAEEHPARAWIISAAIVVLLFVVRPPLAVLGEAVEQSRRGYRFDEIVEREVVERVNAIALPGQTVLAYEVQGRYWLRPDVSLLSLDGITDGLVAPYLESADMGAFLRRHRPEYWIANDAGDYRPYLRRSILQRAIEAFERDRGATSFAIEGITFELLARRERPMPRGFAGWTMLVRLGYDEAPRR